MRGSAAQKRVKGKRAQIPHDLVTVIREPAARVRLHRSLGISPGRRRVRGRTAPDHEELVVPQRAC